MKTTFIYAVGANIHEKKLEHATVVYESVLKQSVVTNRRGDSIVVNNDSLDALIIALQHVQEQIRTGV